MAEILARDDPTSLPAASLPSPRVGPNAVIQLGAALTHRWGRQTAREVFARAGLRHLLTSPPEEMIDETVAARLFESLFAVLPASAAAAVAAQAGTYTADYILANRIPSLAQTALKSMPSALAAPLLLSAIASNAWTFAGSGRLQASAGAPHVIEIADNPLSMPGCVWHVAVFKRLFQVLVAHNAAVHHPLCCHAGATSCRFEITREHPGIDRLFSVFR